MLALDNEAAVLGISAAWSIDEPSGIALWHLKNRNWRCLRVAPSYASFCREIDWQGEIVPGPIDVAGLLQTCKRWLGGTYPTVVGAAIPLARTPIADRRACDRSLNKWFARRGCAVPRPTSRRPGLVGLRFYQGFRAAGFHLVTRPGARTSSRLIEVNADIALLALLRRAQGPRYKVPDTKAYWPGLSARARTVLLIQEWRSILWHLGKFARGIQVPLPDSPEGWSFARLARFQNAIEALACAWMSTEYLAGAARTIGDDKAAVWLPAAAMPEPHR